METPACWGVANLGTRLGRGAEEGEGEGNEERNPPLLVGREAKEVAPCRAVARVEVVGGP